MQTVTLALNAMNTRFELVLHGENEGSLRAAGEEALREVERVEQMLSAFIQTSEIAHINTRAALEPVKVSPEVFALLQQSFELSQMCQGALDITIGPLMRCWGFWNASGSMPVESDIACAMDRVGMQHLQLDERHRTVRFLRKGMTVDLGAIGKGYGVDRAVEVLREEGVTSGLLHGGTSTTYAIGKPPGQSAWRTGIPEPDKDDSLLATVEIRDEALSVSAVSEKAFASEGTIFGHVIDPRTGWPVKETVLSAVVVPDATRADALSTGLMVLGADGLTVLMDVVPGVRGLVVGAKDDPHALATAGIQTITPKGKVVG